LSGQQVREGSPSGRYVNRELSWLRFNRRVLEEAANEDHPLLERLRFLAIFESNLDEFYMVRVSGLIQLSESRVDELSPDGLTAREQLEAITEMAGPMRGEAAALLADRLLPALREHGIVLKRFADLREPQQRHLGEFFSSQVFPLCTPLALDPAPTVPFISNRSLNLLVEVGEGEEALGLARVKVPSVLPRLVPLSKRGEFILLEDLIAHHLHLLFPGVEIRGASLFRVLRDADVEIQELEAPDLIAAVEQTIRLRRFGDPVLLEVASAMPNRLRKRLLQLLDLDGSDLSVVEGTLGMDVLHEIAGLDRPDLRFPAHTPFMPEGFSSARSILMSVRRRDALVHQPFDSFRPIEEFVRSAALDPDVLGIKQTLYRVGTQSPIVEALSQAAEAGKQVAVAVELKARFDESNNLVWARALERAGAHVTYGFPEMKTHCKLCLIVRRERKGVRRYAHIGTGNYNPVTARLYTDLGLLTSDPDITQDLLDLFNYLTGFSRQSVYRKLLVAPLNLREGIIERIRREIVSHVRAGGGRIVFKLNSLVDPEVIDVLYEASDAGVEIDLIVRGICCLRPQTKGLSENIRVLSIVGRFLEHDRVYYFGNGGKPEAFIGSADLMRRNLDRRIEVLTPVERPDLISYLYHGVLESYLRDNQQAWVMGPDGAYVRRKPKSKEQKYDAQQALMEASALRIAFKS
jgi:polyphosphate kinase